MTLFRAYPDGVDTFTVKDREQHDADYREQLLAHNDYNRRIYQLVHDEALPGHGVAISLTECYRQTDYGEPIVALKSLRALAVFRRKPDELDHRPRAGGAATNGFV